MAILKFFPQEISTTFKSPIFLGIVVEIKISSEFILLSNPN